MDVRLRVEGFRDMERALAELPRGTARGVVQRVLKKTLAPVQEMADAYNPAFQIAVTSRLSPRQRRMARGDFASNVVSMFVGPVGQDGSHVPHAHLIEFGTAPRFHESGKYVGFLFADPFLRTAWDAHAPTLLPRLGDAMWDEIRKAIARRIAKAEREVKR